MARKAAEVAHRVRHDGCRGDLAERPVNLPLKEGGTHDFSPPSRACSRSPTSPSSLWTASRPTCRSRSTASTAGRRAGAVALPGQGVHSRHAPRLRRRCAPHCRRALGPRGNGGTACMADEWADACRRATSCAPCRARPGVPSTRGAMGSSGPRRATSSTGGSGSG